MKSVGINGFGRFGLHLLKYWIERFYNSGFIIKYINDENLNIVRIFEILNSEIFFYVINLPTISTEGIIQNSILPNQLYLFLAIIS